MGDIVKVGTCAQAQGVTVKDMVERIFRWGLGNFIGYVADPEDAAFCRKHKIYFFVPELRHRGRIDEVWCFPARCFKDDGKAFYEDPVGALDRIKKAGGEYYFGRSVAGEYGGLVYCPKEYMGHPFANDKMPLPPAENLIDAKKVYIDRLKEIIARDRKMGGEPLITLCSSILHHYHLKAGVDIPIQEVCPGDIYLSQAAIRGACRAYGKKSWGVHISMFCYGGKRTDTLWLKRWKVMLYYCFLSGADPIFMESGFYASHDKRDTQLVEGGEGIGRLFGPNSQQCQQSRKILREFYQFCQQHPRPENGPKATIGIVHGNLDGYAGLWNKQVWGQYNDAQWKPGDAEYAWDYLDDLYQGRKWCNTMLEGDTDFSGNPPYGQYDVVPIEAPDEILGQYTALVFLGWNTMTLEIYEKLKRYVSAGGHLFMTVPHLSTQIRRDEALKLYNNGDISDLFGVIVKGKGHPVTSGIQYIDDPSIKSFKVPNWGMGIDAKFMGEEFNIALIDVSSARIIARSSAHYDALSAPLLTENTYGKGKAFLITSWCYPGHRGIQLFVKQLLRDIAIGEQGDIRLSGSDKIRYALYEENAFKTVYLLNTDFEVSQPTNLWMGKNVFLNILVAPCSLRMAYISGKIVVLPLNEKIHVETIIDGESGCEIVLNGEGEQEIELHLLAAYPKNVSLNGKKIEYLVEKNTKNKNTMIRIKLKTAKNILTVTLK